MTLSSPVVQLPAPVVTSGPCQQSLPSPRQQAAALEPSLAPPQPKFEPSQEGLLPPTAIPRPKARSRGAFSGRLAVASVDVATAATADPLPDFESWWTKEEAEWKTRRAGMKNRDARGACRVGFGYRVEPAFILTKDEVEEVRFMHQQPSWRLEVREQRLRPPRHLLVPHRMQNPVQRLGTCQCQAHRARPDFVRFCHGFVLRQQLSGEALVYATLGSGQLYHDWEILEALRDSGIRFAAVHAIDLAYGNSPEVPGHNAHTALMALAAWLATDSIPLSAHGSLETFVQAGTAAHVLMHSDAPRCAQALPLARAVQPGGILLYMAQGTGAAFQAWERPPADPTGEPGHEGAMEEDPFRGLTLREHQAWAQS